MSYHIVKISAKPDNPLKPAFDPLLADFVTFEKRLGDVFGDVVFAVTCAFDEANPLPHSDVRDYVEMLNGVDILIVRSLDGAIEKEIDEMRAYLYHVKACVGDYSTRTEASMLETLLRRWMVAGNDQDEFARLSALFKNAMKDCV
ncbi:hypothetical protein ACLPJK_26080 [Pseudomonas aeruginosa]|uniref:hypothetical protein n=1 Tax=Pseudomonas aeruginosa TaxID=287 RepID=UPI003D269200